MIRYGIVMALGLIWLVGASMPTVATAKPVLQAALKGDSNPQTLPARPDAPDPFGNPKDPGGLTPELSPATRSPGPPPPVRGNTRPGERTPKGNPLWGVPLNALTVTRERPIFSPSRRQPAPVVVNAPYVPPPPPPPKPAAPIRPQLSLVGTVANGSEGIGIFLDPATNSFVRLRPGEGHGGWILRELRSREAILENGGQTETLSLPPPGLQGTVREKDL